MKTRIVAKFNPASGGDVYMVQKWALWDDPNDLRAGYPNEYDWRTVVTVPGIQDAKDLAEALSHGGDLPDRVIAEFGE